MCGTSRPRSFAAFAAFVVVAVCALAGCPDLSEDTPNQPPVIHPSATPAFGTTPLTVVFAAAAFDTDGTIASYAWNFGDGGTSSEPGPTHVYTTIQNFRVTLSVTDNDGAVSEATVDVSINNVPPTATPSATPTSGTNPLLVSFTGAGTDPDGTIVSYAWAFGDGATSTLQNPTHTYASPAGYTATLTVTDDLGATGSASVNITVNAPANQAPIANAGPDQVNRDPGTTISLSGAASSDPDGSVTSYQWTQTAGSAVSLSGANTSTPSFFAPTNVTASYTFRLLVTDNGLPQLSATDSVTVTTRVTYVNTTEAIFDARCVSCHFTGSARVPLDNYTSVFNNRATIRTKITTGNMRQYLLTGQPEIITSWIDNGAPQTN